MPRPRVELLVSPECPHAARADALLREVLAEQTDIAGTEVEHVYVSDLDHAAGVAFHGSPTIRIDGRDVVPADGQPIGVSCRVYRQPDGVLAGLPPADAVRDAIARWREERQTRAARPGTVDLLRDVPARIMRGGFLWASRRRSLERFATGTPLTRRIVRRFVPAFDLDDALDVLERLRADGLRWTIDVLGESVTSADAARAAARRYLDLLAALEERGLEANVSLKLTGMGLDIDRELCVENVRRIVERAARQAAFVRIDMEDHTKTDVTLEIVRSMHALHPEVGAVIQSYLRRSEADIERLNEERIRVRLCKGAYDEPASVAFATKREVDDSYRRLTEALLLHGRYPALATHDERMIEHACWFATEQGIGPERFEFQMLYGIRRDVQERLVTEGWTVRVYVPYGTEWYPYYMRRLAERPANAFFILRNLLRG